jgi:dipeptide/tripeptide permease
MPDLAMSAVGTVVLGMPAYVVLWLALRRQPRAIFLFGLALMLVGLGYLVASGATAAIGKRAVDLVSGVSAPAGQPAPAR